MITGLLYGNDAGTGEVVQVNNLTYNGIAKLMSLGTSSEIIEQFPWPDKPYVMLTLEFGSEDDVTRDVSDMTGFSWEITGPILFLHSEVDDDDYSSLSEADIEFIRQMVSDEVR